MNTDYLCEQRLSELDSGLHRRFRDSVFTLQRLLTRYKNIFPTFTDHTALHSMEVLDFCNALIGREQVKELNADELYILMMSCYLHDSGMGITKSDFEEFKENINVENYFETHKDVETPDFIRDFHNEFSGEYIKKYAEFFDIPSKEHVFAIVQVSRGHRKTDLYDEKEYPSAYELPNGNTVCMPYLAALIRLADELDVAADRNLQFIYDLETITHEFSKMEFLKHEAIRHLNVYDTYFEMKVCTDDEKIFEGVKKLRDKCEATLNYCCDVVEKRTKYEIKQNKIEIERITE